MDCEERQLGSDSPVACKLLGREFAERKEAMSRELFAHAELVEELQDGYAFRFAGADPWDAKMLEFINTERQCCPFFRFEIVFEPNDGPVWLRLRGSTAVKEFMLLELDGIVPNLVGRT